MSTASLASEPAAPRLLALELKATKRPSVLTDASPLGPLALLQSG